MESQGSIFLSPAVDLSTDDEYHRPRFPSLAEKAVLTATMNDGPNEIGPDIKVMVAAGMKLRYIGIDPEIVAELPEWSQAEIEREGELTLRDLGISRQPNESYLNAWARAMLSENCLDDNAENRKRLTEALGDHPDVLRFVWVIGGDERKAFGLEDSPAFQEHLVRHHAARSLAPGCFYDQDDPRYYDYVRHEKSPQTKPAKSSGIWQRARSGQITETVLGLLAVAAGAWAARGLAAPVGWRPVDFLVLLVWIGLAAAGAGLLLGFRLALCRSSVALQRLALLVAATAALTAISLHMAASRKMKADAAQRERFIVTPKINQDSVEEVGYVYEVRRVDRLWEQTREITWFVKIPATNERYSCSWESGFTGFEKDDAVKLIHKKPDSKKYDYRGFIIGLHGNQNGRSAAVWALDEDELEMLIEDTKDEE